jgi:hypothetical protein
VVLSYRRKGVNFGESRVLEGDKGKTNMIKVLFIFHGRG